MQCKNCGNQIFENDKFCQNCGAPTDTVDVPQQPEVTPEINTVEPVQTVQPEMNQQPVQPEVTPEINTVEPVQTIQPEMNQQPVQPEVTPEMNTVEPVQTVQPEINQQPVQPEVTPMTNTVNQTSNMTQPAFDPLGGASNSMAGQTSNMNNVQSPMPKKSSNKKFIIIGGCVLVVILVVVGIFLLKDHDEKSESNKTNVNEYEIDDNDTKDVIDDILDDDKDTDDTDTTDVDQNSSEITLKKFKFKKVAGYEYKVTSDKLEVSNNSTYFVIDIELSSFDTLKSNTSQLVKQFESMGYAVKNVQTKTYSGTEYITLEVTKDSISMLMLFAKADNNYVYIIGAANRSYTIDYNLVSQANTIIKNATYIG